MAQYPSYDDLAKQITQAIEKTGVGRIEAQERAERQLERYQQEIVARNLAFSKAHTPTPREDDFPIKFILKEEESFRIFHKLEERRRGETSWLKKFRLRVAIVTILGLIGYLIVAILGR